METDTAEKQEQQAGGSDPAADRCYMLQFRPAEQMFSASAKIQNLTAGELVMAQTDHGLEPAVIKGGAPCPPEGKDGPAASYVIVRRGSREEKDKYDRLIIREKESFDLCQKFIEKHRLAMKLIKVERFFNGSKIIFYFTAENRVDFRELVKDLVQEFRTRVEIRQIGVRHETKMLGGLGCCGRELCCASFIKNFAPVSIKMAKEQGLPLNPAKISGICNRLLCCLTYEFPIYHAIRKQMPKVGKTISLNGQSWKVIKNDVLQETITVVPVDDSQGTARTLARDDWKKAVTGPAPKGKANAKPRRQKKQAGGKGPDNGEAP